MDLKLVVEEELKKGWEATSQLRSLLSQPQEQKSQHISNERKMEFMKIYSNTILHSFDNSISILKEAAKNMEMEALSSVDRTSNGCPSKNRFQTIVTSNVTPDGHTWRKYGKKSIQHSNHPREYYRCAFRQDQQCEATKHVQKLSDNPTKYRITYYAHHTCQPLNKNNNNNVHNIIINTLDSLENDFTNFISFESKNPITFPKQEFNPVDAFNPSTSLTTIAAHPPSISVDTTMVSSIMDPSPLVDDGIACINDHDVLFSPRTFMNQDYYMPSSNLEAEDYNFMDGDCSDINYDAWLDLPLWD